METRNVFLYWIGKEYKLISILRNLIYLHSTSGKGYKVNLITDKNINDYVKNIPVYFDNLCPAHKADFVRVNVICDYGGIWLDSDTIVLDSLDSLFDLVENKNGFFILENNNILWNGIFGSKSNTPIMIKWRNEMTKLLDNKQGIIDWSDIGSDMLVNLYNMDNGLYEDYKIFNGLDNLYPVNWNKCTTEFIDKPYDNYKTIIREYQPLIVLVNSVYKILEDKSEKEILEGDMPINYFINKSFENISNNNYNNLINCSDFNDNLRILNNNLKNELEKNNFLPILIGNLFYDHAQPNFYNSSLLDECHEKRKRFSKACSMRNTMFEIGLNGGHSTFLALMSNKNLKIYSNDIAEFYHPCPNIHPEIYVKVASDTLKTLFDDRFTFIKGSCLSEVPKFIKNNPDIKFDIIHIDGEKSSYKQEFFNLMPSLNDNAIVIFDDTNYQPVQMMVDELINNKYLHRSHDFPQMNTKIKYRNEILIYKKQSVINVKKYVIYTDWLESYLQQERFIFIKNLEILGWQIIKLSELDIENIKKTKSIVLCFTYDDFDVSLIKCDNVKIIYKIDDLYPFKNIRNKSIENSNMIISPTKFLFDTDEFKKFYKNINTTNSFYIPYSSVDEFFSELEFNDKPKNKVLISGAVNNVYPLREFICSNIFNEYTERLVHPSYNKYTHNFIQGEYYKKLNEYLCCFTDASLYKYVLAKVFEICSVGSLLLVEDTIKNELNDLGFFDNINCIFCNKNNLENKLKWILNDENRYLVDNIRKSGMELVRQQHTTKKRAKMFNDIVKKYFENDIFLTSDKINSEYMKNKCIFENIYEKQLWNDSDPSIPLSGPGSSLENTKDYSNMLTKFIYDNECKSLLDLGCGDLTWISKSSFFNDTNIKYTGVDIVESLITLHLSKFPEKQFLCKDITIYKDFDNADIIIIRDVIFHLKNEQILSIFNNIKNKFKFLIITNCKNELNTDNFDKWYFSRKNILIEPFNKSNNFIMKLEEPKFNRNVLIYTHNSFYNL